jgi:predicted KAP-like P-loop ATPase
MKSFVIRAIRGVLLGVLLGATAALFLRILDTATGGRTYSPSFPATLMTIPLFWALVLVIAGTALLLTANRLGSLAGRTYRSWTAGVVTGIIPVWFLVTLLFFVGTAQGNKWRLVVLIGAGVLPIIGGVFWHYRVQHSICVPVVIPANSTSELKLGSKSVEFDLPIRDWAEDCLNRGSFIESVANLILRQYAPVVAIVGSFGDGKTSFLNLLHTTLSSRNDLVVVNFNSWLPGDQATLASSLFATIAGQVQSKYLIPGLTKELRHFARMLAGTVPKVGATLKQYVEEISQTEQLSTLKRLLERIPIRVVVLVDEVDRMDSEELHLLLKAIRGVVDLPRITYVCAFDRKTVTRLISADDPEYGQRYLEKFFPVQRTLPRIDQELLARLFDSKLDAICQRFGLLHNDAEKKEFDDDLLPLWHRSIKRYLSNFRRMNLFFNSLEMALEPIHAEVHLYDMLVLQIVKMLSEDAYQFIYDNGSLFYHSGWRIGLWFESLHVDDKRNAALRSERLNEFLDSFPSTTKQQLTPLLSEIFPAVEQAVHKERFSLAEQSEQAADKARRIYHPDYFPRYFIHQVPAAMFGRAELTDFINKLNAQGTIDDCICVFRETTDELAKNPLKRWSLLDNFVGETSRLGDMQSEAVILATAEVSHLFDSDVFGIGEWGRARALLFAAAQRFEGARKLEDVLVAAIDRCSSDGFAADILRYSTAMRPQNNVITNWQNVDELSIKAAFSGRMRERYRVGAAEFRYHKDDLTSFFIWVNASDEDGAREVEFWRDRFRRNPAETGRFLGWVNSILYQGEPLIAVEKLFPVDELFELVGQRNDDRWLERERQSVNWFRELVLAKRQRNEAQNPVINALPEDGGA